MTVSFLACPPTLQVVCRCTPDNTMDYQANGGRVILDWRWSMSESPMSPLVPHARFSQLDQVSTTASLRESSSEANDIGRGTSEHDLTFYVLI